jgi:hypothetical protein
MTKKKPSGRENTQELLVTILTADDDPKEYANDEIPDGHRYHDARDGDILHFANAVTCVPECLFDEINSQHED